jgi:hypothetical protein
MTTTDWRTALQLWADGNNTNEIAKFLTITGKNIVHEWQVYNGLSQWREARR